MEPPNNQPPAMPEGHLPCPHCGEAVLPTAPLCPNCGAVLQAGTGRRRNSGLWVLLGGLLAAVLGGVSFFGGCMMALGGGGANTGAAEVGQVFLVLGMVLAGGGLIAMLVGFIWALVQAVRR